MRYSACWQWLWQSILARNTYGPVHHLEKYTVCSLSLIGRCRLLWCCWPAAIHAPSCTYSFFVGKAADTHKGTSMMRIEASFQSLASSLKTGAHLALVASSVRPPRFTGSLIACPTLVKKGQSPGIIVGAYISSECELGWLTTTKEKIVLSSCRVKGKSVS